MYTSMHTCSSALAFLTAVQLQDVDLSGVFEMIEVNKKKSFSTFFPRYPVIFYLFFFTFTFTSRLIFSIFYNVYTM